MARQFNMIPPICEQAEYHMFQREKVEVHLPELFHKIGKQATTFCTASCPKNYDYSFLTVEHLMEFVIKSISLAHGQKSPDLGVLKLISMDMLMHFLRY